MRGLQAGSMGKAFTDGEVKGGRGLCSTEQPWGRNGRVPTEVRVGEENGRGCVCGGGFGP